MSISILTVPPLEELAKKDSSQAFKTWEHLYHLGKITNPKFAAIALVSYAYAAYDSYSHTAPWAGFLGAGALTIALAPWTLTAMRGTNEELHKAACGVSKDMGAEKARSLFQEWGRLNFVRGIFPLAGAGVGMWALLGT